MGQTILPKLDICSILEGETSLSLKIYIEQISKFKLYTNKQISILLRKCKEGDEGAYVDIVKSNLYQVVNIAKLYKGYGVKLEELIQEGNIGLLTAIADCIQHDNPHFYSHSNKIIHQSIQLTLLTFPNLIYFPINQVSNHNTVQRHMSMYYQRYEIPATESELSSLKQIYDIRYYMDLPDVLSKMMVLVENIDEVYEDPVSGIDSAQSIESRNPIIMKLLSKLATNERIILILYFGLNNNEEHSFSQISEKCGLSTEDVIQLYNISIKKLRKIIYKSH